MKKWPGASVTTGAEETTTGRIDGSATLATLNAFTNVGATGFHLTLLDVAGKEQGYQSNRSVEELRRSMARRLEAATSAQQSIVTFAPCGRDAAAYRDQNYRRLQKEPLRTTEGYAIWSRIADYFVERFIGEPQKASQEVS
jgi:hypothetical protein